MEAIGFHVYEYYGLLGFAFLASYCLGSIPFGLVLTRLAGLGDVRAIGSGNIGATNVLRTGRKDIAFLTLLLDALKGTLAVMSAQVFLPRDGIGDIEKMSLSLIVVAAVGVFLGHLFPVWLKFKGGKGVATYIGILLGFSLPAFLVFAVSWLCTAFATRFSSIAAITASIITPIALFFMGEPVFALFLGLLSLLLISRHRENIRRLLRGEESKIRLS